MRALAAVVVAVVVGMAGVQVLSFFRRPCSCASDPRAVRVTMHDPDASSLSAHEAPADVSVSSSRESFGDAFCRLGNHRLWQRLHDVRLDVAKHRQVWGALLREVIAAEVLIERPGFQKMQAPALPAMTQELCTDYGFDELLPTTAPKSA